jgi:hypothetical protein
MLNTVDKIIGILVERGQFDTSLICWFKIGLSISVALKEGQLPAHFLKANASARIRLKVFTIKIAICHET